MNDHSPAFNYISICTGGGGLDLGFERAVRGARLITAVEIESYARAVLAARMEEGTLASAPVYSDAYAFCGTGFRGLVDAVIGGTPCTDLSVAGRQAGLDGPKSKLFFEYCRIVDECQPGWILWENVGGAKKVLPRVFQEFEAIGYRGKCVSIRASDVGATHQRARFFILAHRADARLQRSTGGGVQSQQPRQVSCGVADAHGGDRHGGTSEQRRRTLFRAAAGWSIPSVADAQGHGSGPWSLRRGIDPQLAKPASDRIGVGYSERELDELLRRSEEFPSPFAEIGGPGFSTAGDQSGTADGDLADTSGLGRGEGRAQSDAEGEASSDESGADVADSDGWRLPPIRAAHHQDGRDARRHHDDGRGSELADADDLGRPPKELPAGESKPIAGDDELAHARDARLQGSERPGTPCEDARAPRPVAERSRPLWPPGPDGDWSRIPTRFFPAQPTFCRVADGVAGRLEQSIWADRLRMLGNGVVPLQAEEAIRFLFHKICTQDP